MTVNPYLCSDGVLPFLKAAEKYDKAIFALDKTSNPSSGELQDLDCGGMPLYMRTAALIGGWNRQSGGRCGAVVGATYPEQLRELRAALPDAFFLVPGYGAQGGKASDIAGAYDKNGGGVIVNSSRGLMCAYKNRAAEVEKDHAAFERCTREAVEKMRDELLAAR